MRFATVSIHPPLRIPERIQEVAEGSSVAIQKSRSSGNPIAYRLTRICVAPDRDRLLPLPLATSPPGCASGGNRRGPG